MIEFANLFQIGCIDGFRRMRIPEMRPVDADPEYQDQDCGRSRGPEERNTPTAACQPGFELCFEALFVSIGQFMQVQSVLQLRSIAL